MAIWSPITSLFPEVPPELKSLFTPWLFHIFHSSVLKDDKISGHMFVKNAFLIEACFNALPKQSKSETVGWGVEKFTLFREDYELRPAHSTCREWLENPYQNNPENLTQQLCNEVQLEKSQTTWGTNPGRPGLP